VASAPHVHECAICGSTWVCARIMDEETDRQCAHAANRASVCAACMGSLEPEELTEEVRKKYARSSGGRDSGRPRVPWVHACWHPRCGKKGRSPMM